MSVSSISFLADEASVVGGWFSQGAKYYNQTNSSSGVQTFKLGNADGSQIWNGHDIGIDFQSSKYVVTDLASGAPQAFFVGSSDPTGALTATTVDLINSSDYLYVLQSLTTGDTEWVKLDLTGPGTSGSGSGAGTLSINNSGSFSLDGAGLRWLISAVSGDGDYFITSVSSGTATTVDTISISGSGYLGFAIRTGLVSSFNPLLTYKLYDPAEEVLATYSPSLSRKVHCNFW